MSNVEFFIKQLAPEDRMGFEIVKCGYCDEDGECIKTSEENIDAYLCLACGYQTTSNFKVDTEAASNMMNSMPQLVRDLAKVCKSTNTYWTPAIIHIPTIGMLYPSGGLEDWKWSVSPYVANDMKKDGFGKEEYSHRLAVEQGKEFANDDFAHAMENLKQLVLLHESSSTSQ